MGLMSRNKGKAAEREVAALLADLTGLQVKRRVRQHDGDSDLEGLPGWCVEVKRHAKAPRASVRQWWKQATEQAARVGAVPVLLYRQDFDAWRAVWPLSVTLTQQSAAMWVDYELTAEGTPEAWAAVLRESMTMEQSQ
jgi:Holliday junction resolvase